MPPPTGVVSLQCVADGTLTIAAKSRALAFPPGWTIQNFPDTALAPGPFGEQCTGYNLLVPSLVNTLLASGPTPVTIFATPDPASPFLTWDGDGTFEFNPANTYTLMLSGAHGVALTLDGNGVQLAARAGTFLTSNATGFAFWGASPMAQPARIGQLGAQDVGAIPTQTSINAAFAAAVAKINALETLIHNLGLTA